MSLTFYHAPMSTSNLTEAVLAELGIPFEQVKLDIQAGDTRKPEFLAINPNGKVPAIVHDGTAIWESAAITIYLGEVFGVAAKLYPELGPKRGEAMKWIVWTNTVLAEAAGGLYAGADRAEKAKQDLAAGLAILDGGLAGKSFLLGEYSLADTHVQCIVGWLAMMQIDLASHTNVAAWMKRCAERPALAKLMAG